MMDIIVLKHFLCWTAAVNYCVLIAWFVALTVAHDWLYQWHTSWFKLSVETFDALHYAGLSIYKVGILLFNIAPLIALYMMG